MNKATLGKRSYHMQIMWDEKNIVISRSITATTIKVHTISSSVISEAIDSSISKPVF